MNRIWQGPVGRKRRIVDIFRKCLLKDGGSLCIGWSHRAGTVAYQQSRKIRWKPVNSSNASKIASALVAPWS
jgi:hypothetical protein